MKLVQASNPQIAGKWPDKVRHLLMQHASDMHSSGDSTYLCFGRLCLRRSWLSVFSRDLSDRLCSVCDDGFRLCLPSLPLLSSSEEAALRRLFLLALLSEERPALRLAPRCLLGLSDLLPLSGLLRILMPPLVLSLCWLLSLAPLLLLPSPSEEDSCLGGGGRMTSSSFGNDTTRTWAPCGIFSDLATVISPASASSSGSPS